MVNNTIRRGEPRVKLELSFTLVDKHFNTRDNIPLELLLGNSHHRRESWLVGGLEQSWRKRAVLDEDTLVEHSFQHIEKVVVDRLVSGYARDYQRDWLGGVHLVNRFQDLDVEQSWKRVLDVVEFRRRSVHHVDGLASHFV